MYRQGDVLIMKAPPGIVPGKAVPRDGGRVVLAYGEVTGHAHALVDDGIELFELAVDQDGRSPVNDNSARLLVVPKPAALTHEEHAPIHLDPGQYVVIRQREYTPERLQYVAD
jgi:hypothetical protein